MCVAVRIVAADAHDGGGERALPATQSAASMAWMSKFAM